MADENNAAAEQATETAEDAQEAPEADSGQNVVDSENANQTAAAEGGEGEKPAESSTPPRTPWFQQRINELTRGKYDEQRRREAVETELQLLKRQLAAVQGNSGDADGGEPDENASARPKVTRTPISVAPADEIERRADELATQKAAQRAFAEACNATNLAGEKAHPDFPSVRDGLNSSFGEVLIQKPEFYETITALPNGHEVFYKLAKDLDKASDILALPRTKMIVELTRMGDEIERAGKRAPVSKAPPPLRTIDGSGRSPEVDPDKLSMPEWVKWRNKQAAEADRARWSR